MSMEFQSSTSSDAAGTAAEAGASEREENNNSNSHSSSESSSLTATMTSAKNTAAASSSGESASATVNSSNTSVADVSNYRLQQQNNQSSNQVMWSTGEDDLKMEPMNCGFLDQTAQIGFSGLDHQNRMSNSGGGLGGLDWQFNGGGGDQGFIDFTGTVDQTYLGQNQWSDNDQSLNFPPLV